MCNLSHVPLVCCCHMSRDGGTGGEGYPTIPRVPDRTQGPKGPKTETELTPNDPRKTHMTESKNGERATSFIYWKRSKFVRVLYIKQVFEK